MKKSKWMKGLLWAELMGVPTATWRVRDNEFGYGKSEGIIELVCSNNSLAFAKGAQDYLTHAQRLIDIQLVSTGDENVSRTNPKGA